MAEELVVQIELAGERLALNGQELHCGDPIEVPLQLLGRWVSARVEWSPALGWYALAPRAGRDHKDLAIPLHPGSPVRAPYDRGRSR